MIKRIIKLFYFFFIKFLLSSKIFEIIISFLTLIIQIIQYNSIHCPFFYSIPLNFQHTNAMFLHFSLRNNHFQISIQAMNNIIIYKGETLNELYFIQGSQRSRKLIYCLLLIFLIIFFFSKIKNYKKKENVNGE